MGSSTEGPYAADSLEGVLTGVNQGLQLVMLVQVRSSSIQLCCDKKSPEESRVAETPRK